MEVPEVTVQWNRNLCEILRGTNIFVIFGSVIVKNVGNTYETKTKVVKILTIRPIIVIKLGAT